MSEHVVVGNGPYTVTMEETIGGRSAAVKGLSMEMELVAAFQVFASKGWKLFTIHNSEPALPLVTGDLDYAVLHNGLFRLTIWQTAYEPKVVDRVSQAQIVRGIRKFVACGHQVLTVENLDNREPDPLIKDYKREKDEAYGTA